VASIYPNLALEATVDFEGSTVFTGNSAPTDVFSLETNSAVCTLLYAPSDIGTYDMNFVFNGDGMDGFDGNNEIDDSFEVTEYLYARGDGNFTGRITNFSTNTGLPFQFGNGYQIHDTDTLGVIDVQL